MAEDLQFNAKDAGDVNTKIAVLYERIINMEKMAAQYQQMTQDAIDKAEKSMNTRLEGMNEFRDQLKQQSATFVTAEKFDAMKGGYELGLKQTVEKFEQMLYAQADRINKMELKDSAQEGSRKTQNAILGFVIIIISTLLSWFLKTVTRV